MRLLPRCVVAVFVLLLAPLTASAQDSSSLYVVRYIEAAPSAQAQVATMLKQFAEASRADSPAGFEVLQGTITPNQFMMLEVWKDQSALDAHAAAAHTRQFMERMAPLVLAPMDERLCVSTATGPPKNGRGTFYVVTHVDVTPPTREATVSLLGSFAEQSRTESGNLRFDIVHQKDRTNHFTVIETWADQKADDTHRASARTKTFRTTLAPMLGALYDQRWYKPL